MRWSLSIGRIAGIRIQLHYTFIAFLGLMAIRRGVLARDAAGGLSELFILALIFGCVLLHELGHALAARRYGIPTRDITLLPIGGLARLERIPEKPSQELVVAIAGPLVNVAIVVITFAAGVMTHALDDPVTAMLLEGGVIETLLVVNIVMVAFNLVPAFPMDGGRVLRALLAMRLTRVRATQIAAFIGQAIALVFVVAGAFGIPGIQGPSFMLVLVAVFVFFSAAEERNQVRRHAL